MTTFKAQGDPAQTVDREIRAPRGSELTCANWAIEAPFRMLQNNLDPDVAEDPARLVVYGGSGKAARNPQALEGLLETFKRLKPDETMLIQSGASALRVFRTHEDAPRVLDRQLATWSPTGPTGTTSAASRSHGAHHVRPDDRRLSWIYIGSQGIVQGTYETFMAAAAAALRRFSLEGAARRHRRASGGWAARSPSR
jgi:urocanate hydratase